MRPRYLEEHAEWVKRGEEPPPIVRFMQGPGDGLVKIALMVGDLEGFGDLMNQNHRLVNEMMAYCCFEDGAGWRTTCSSGRPCNMGRWAPATGAWGVGLPSPAGARAG